MPCNRWLRRPVETEDPHWGRFRLATTGNEARRARSVAAETHIVVVRPARRDETET